MTAARLWLQLLAVTALIALGGCGAGSSGTTAEGGMGGSGGGSSNDQYAEGGMGGSGSGTSSGYGSIIVNDTRHFPIDPNADVFVDGERVAPDAINDVDRGVPLGMTLEYVLAGDANDELTEGTAIGIRAHHRAIGPVTGTDPLEVLGQQVLVTSETHGLGESGSEDLATGDVVKVDGHVNGDGTIRATRLVEEPVSDWQLMGRVDSDSVGSGSFEIGGQEVVLNGAPIEGCGTGLDDHERVLVRATASESFSEDGVLDTVYQVRCPVESLSLFNELDKAPDAPAELSTSYEGIVTEIVTEAVDPTNLDQTLQDLANSDNPVLSLSLNGQKVSIPLDNLPELLSGTLGDLVQNLGVGVKIEVEGTLDTETGVIAAEKIRFRDPIVSLTGPLVDVDGTARLLGHTLNTTAGLLDDVLNSLKGNNVRLRGFITEQGRIYAHSVDNYALLDPSYPGEEMRAPVQSIDSDQNRLFLGATSLDLTSTSEAKLLEGSYLLGTLSPIWEITEGIACELLSSLLSLSCNDTNEVDWPEDPDGAVAEISGSSWDDGFSSGTLKVRQTGQ